MTSFRGGLRWLGLRLRPHRPFLSRYWQRRNGDVFAVNVDSTIGFGASLEWCLEILMHCDTNALTPCLMLTGRNYRSATRGPDWFSYFFEQPALSDEQRERISSGRVHVSKVRTIRDLGLPRDYDAELTFDKASALVGKYLRVRKEILDEVDHFCKEHFNGRFALGVHYRGTDKIGEEASPIPWDRIERKIRHYLDTTPKPTTLFVSSDERGFIDWAEETFASTVAVVFRRDAYRSADGMAVYNSRDGDRYERGRDALVNCLILSRCSLLIKTPSILSGWSKIFNPSLPVVMVGTPFANQRYFPEREILETSRLAPIA
jgi:hypothetical protein